jgi:hypothetical protein
MPHLAAARFSVRAASPKWPVFAGKTQETTIVSYNSVTAKTGSTLIKAVVMADDNKRVRQELIELFGEEKVDLYVTQEILAQRFIQKHPIEIRKALYKFRSLKTLDEQREMVGKFDEQMARAFVCALLSGSASAALLDLAIGALEDRRARKPVLPNRLIR